MDENIKCACCLFGLGFLSLTNISCGVSCHVFKYCSLLGMHCNLIFFLLLTASEIVIHKVKPVLFTFQFDILPFSVPPTSASVSSSLCFVGCCELEKGCQLVSFIRVEIVCDKCRLTIVYCIFCGQFISNLETSGLKLLLGF